MVVPDPIVYAERLAKQYGTRTAVVDWSLAIPAGAVFALVGPNGAGKSTVVKMLLGLVRPSRGQAWVMDRPPGDPESRASIGYLPELFRYPPWMRVEEVLRLHARLLHLSDTDQRFATLLEKVGLPGRARDRVATLSKGQQQRLGLAIALLGHPRLVFLDEPTSALDPVGRIEVRRLIGECRREGITVCLNSHLLAEVEQVSDYIAAMYGGRVVAAGRLSDWLAPRELWLSLDGPPATVEQCLRRFGPPRRRDRWWVMPAPEDAAVPRLVAALVEAGIAVAAVERRAPSLEERFLEWVSQAQADAPRGEQP